MDHVKSEEECEDLIPAFSLGVGVVLVVQNRCQHQRPKRIYSSFSAGQAPAINDTTLDEMLDELYSDSAECEYVFKETHQYTMSCLRVIMGLEAIRTGYVWAGLWQTLAKHLLVAHQCS